MPAPTLLYGRELASRLGMSYADLMMLRREGVVEGIRLTDGRYLFNLDHVVKAIRVHNRDSASAEAVCAS